MTVLFPFHNGTVAPTWDLGEKSNPVSWPKPHGVQLPGHPAGK